MTKSLVSILKITGIAISIFIMHGISLTTAQIPNGLELNGYAWSSNIGWISLNCRTGGPGRSNICATSDYRVAINPANRHLNGYAWSPNIGWIRFGSNLSQQNIPTGSGTVSVGARLSSDTFENATIEGWARACAGTASTLDGCANANNSTVSGNWDGWISFKGSNHQVNTRLFSTARPAPNNPAFRNRFAWGGAVVGWVDMVTDVSWYRPTALSGTGCTITTAGQSTCNGTLTWAFSPDITNPTIVRTAPTSPALSFTGATATNRSAVLRLGNNTFAARSGANGSNIVTHSISAVCGNGLVNTSGVCQTPPPAAVSIISLTASPSIVRRGNTAFISWTLSSAPVAGQCALSGPGFTNVDIAGRTNYTTPALSATSRITLNCGVSVRDVTITVVPAFNEI